LSSIEKGAEYDMIQSQLEELECMERCDSDILIAELIRNQQKIKANYELYYDEKQDQSLIDHYYCNVTKDSADPLILFKEYHNLVTNTHQYRHPYYISKDQYLYTWVDLQPNGQLKSIYSGKQKDPQQIIEEDFTIIEKRFNRFQNLIKIQRFTDKQIENQVRRISNQHKFNTEHVVPQSWFRAKEPMKGDLHHLFACEPKCNSIRSNYPYYEYETNQYLVNVRNNCGKHEMNRFEPAYGKGIVARATLYFLLRYPKKITRKFKKSIDISLLFRWHEQFKVSDYEKHRNKAIFVIQGNRNPFIDFPQLMTNISFPEFQV